MSTSHGRSDRIALVEDDDDAREALELLLRGEGFDVLAVGSARQGLAVLREHGCDLLLTDYNLPDETGGWLIATALAEGVLPRGGALVITGRSDVRVEGVKVLPKPVDFDRLVFEVEGALGGVRDARRNTGSARPQVELVLYVTASSIASIRAARNLKRVLAEYDGSAVELTTIDVAERPDEAAADRVDFTPTIVRRRPDPPFRLLGDLRNRNALDDLLQSAGLKRV